MIDTPVQRMKIFQSLVMLSLLLASGCGKAVEPGSEPVTPTTEMAETALPASTATPEPSKTPLPSPEPTATLDPAAMFTLSSPLEDVGLNELASIISEPFADPGPGLDSGHHGTDFAFYSRGTHDTMVGLPIHSVLNGRVAAVINDVDPYGYLIIIETPGDTIPAELIELLQPPVQQTPFPYNPRMQFCPGLKEQTWIEDTGSLYLLYGHMKDASPLSVGEQVASGDVIGQVGNTGMSGNPHLHLEMRWGPGGTEFASMNYYDTGATQEEMDQYCIWRVSGMFVLQDPMAFFDAWFSLTP